jgi:hypothetical protein
MDPFAIRRIRIYRSAVSDENLVLTIPVNFLPCDPDPANDYPFPITRDFDGESDLEPCEVVCNGVPLSILVGGGGSTGDMGDPIPGAYSFIWDVPPTCEAGGLGLLTPDIYFDVWDFLPEDCRNECGEGSNPTTGGCSATDLDPCFDDEENFISQCNQFWLYPDSWYVDDQLTNIRLGFEALDCKMRQPEVRTIEVGMMPLPLYDFDFNLVAPIIPQLQATITIETSNNETLVSDAPMTIGIRQGSYRTNPFTLRYTVDTSTFLKGTYRYQVKVVLPNGETRVSDYFFLQIQ